MTYNGILLLLFIENNEIPARRKRSISKEYFVETLVVVDNTMVEYYKNEDINTYIFTIMNMVRHTSFLNG